jgi:hypothetical protein
MGERSSLRSEPNVRFVERKGRPGMILPFLFLKITS